MIRSNQRRSLVWVLGLASLLGFAACDEVVDQTGVPGIDKFTEDGPLDVVQVRAGTCTLFLGPTDGSPKPALGWANGTGATPGMYAGILTRVASYGVQVTAANTTQSGTGQELDACIDQLAASDLNIDPRFCAAGHSQGGSGSVNASRLNERVVCTIPVQPDNRFTAQSNGRDIDGPALILCGSSDELAPCNGSTSNGNGLYNQANVPITQITVTNGEHIGEGSPVGDGSLYSALVTAQTQAVLIGDSEAQAALFGPNPGAAQGDGLQDVRSKNF